MEQRMSNSPRRGWLVVAIVAGLVLLSGIYPLVVPVDEGDFERETGAVWAEFQTEEPAVADYLEREARAVAVAVIGFAALALGLAAGPLRQGEASAWRVLWIFTAALTLIAVVFFLSGGVTIGVMYLVLVGLTVLGLWLSRSQVTAGSAPLRVVKPNTDHPASTGTARSTASSNITRVWGSARPAQRRQREPPSS